MQQPAPSKSSAVRMRVTRTRCTAGIALVRLEVPGDLITRLVAGGWLADGARTNSAAIGARTRVYAGCRLRTTLAVGGWDRTRATRQLPKLRSSVSRRRYRSKDSQPLAPAGFMLTSMETSRLLCATIITPSFLCRSRQALSNALSRSSNASLTALFISFSFL